MKARYLIQECKGNTANPFDYVTLEGAHTKAQAVQTETEYRAAFGMSNTRVIEQTKYLAERREYNRAAFANALNNS